MLNDLMSEADLAKLSRTQREFLVQRIDYVLDNDDQVRNIIASKLEKTIGHIEADVKVRSRK